MTDKIKLRKNMVQKVESICSMSVAISPQNYIAIDDIAKRTGYTKKEVADILIHNALKNVEWED